MSELRKDKAETFEDGETQSVAVASGEGTVDEVVRMLLDVQVCVHKQDARRDVR